MFDSWDGRKNKKSAYLADWRNNSIDLSSTLEIGIPVSSEYFFIHSYNSIFIVLEIGALVFRPRGSAIKSLLKNIIYVH